MRKCVTFITLLVLLCYTYMTYSQECNRQTDDIDCWGNMEICNQNAPVYHRADLPVENTDTLGRLVASQWLWRLPGIDHMAHGYHMFKGTKANYPIFLFCYQNTTEKTRRLQDTYRGNSYILPDYVYATSYPQCSYSTETNQYSSAYELALNTAASIGIVQEGNVEAHLRDKFNVNAHQIFELDLAMRTALNTQESGSGSLTSTEAKCATTSIQLNYQDVSSFHPEFIADLKNTAVEDMLSIIDKYGTHYYRSVVMGGKLVQFSVTSEEYQSGSVKIELDAMAHAGFGGGAKLAKFSANANVDVTGSFKTALQKQYEFESNTTRSSIVTYGGAPGSFDSNDITYWNEWAKSVDLLPVPIDYKLGEIADLIPDTQAWADVKEKWKTAVGDYLNLKAATPKKIFGSNYLFFVSTNQMTNVGAGPYGIKLYDSNNQLFQQTVFEKIDVINKTTIFTGFNSFNSYGNYVFSSTDYRNPNFNGLIYICDMEGIAGSAITYNSNSLQGFGMNGLTIVDTYSGNVYVYSPESYVSGTDHCVFVPTVAVQDGISLHFTSYCNATILECADTTPVRVTVVGTTGSMITIAPLRGLVPMEGYTRLSPTSWNRSNFNIGLIKRVEFAMMSAIATQRVIIDTSLFYVKLCLADKGCTMFESVYSAKFELRASKPVSVWTAKV
jgi:hypothetical protein